MLDDDIPGDELLYRSVRPEEVGIANGIIVRIHAQAFADRSKRISVDRASLVDFQPDRSRLSPDQFMALLPAGDARAQAPINYNPPRPTGHTGEWPPQTYGVGVSSDPLSDNAAHALIHLIPSDHAASTAFDRLKHRLARLINAKLEAGEVAVLAPGKQG